MIGYADIPVNASKNTAVLLPPPPIRIRFRSHTADSRHVSAKNGSRRCLWRLLSEVLLPSFIVWSR